MEMPRGRHGENGRKDFFAIVGMITTTAVWKACDDAQTRYLFPSLTRLNVYTDHVVLTTVLLDYIQSSQMKRVFVGTSQALSCDDLQSPNSVLGSQPSSATITHLQLNLGS